MASIATPLPGAIAQRLDAYKAAFNLMSETENIKFAGVPPLPPLGEFIDRPELELLEAQLYTPLLRALVVVGPGGAGKTALAQRFIATLERERHKTGSTLGVEGIVYLSARTGGISLERLYMLCAQLIGGDVETALTAFWNNAAISIGAKAAKLVQKLQDGFYLLVFDDVPTARDDPTQLPPDIALFLEKLNDADNRERVKVLATSREERLASRYLARITIPTGIAAPQALQLLRARGVGESDDVLMPLIEAVRGAPRAVELVAAALLQGLSAQDLLSSLADMSIVLEERLTRLALRNYRSFSVEERHVLEVLSVFDRPVPAACVDLVRYVLFGGEPDSGPLLGRLTTLGAVHGETLEVGARSIMLFSMHDIDAAAILSQLGDTRAGIERAASRFYHEMRRPHPWRHIREADMHLIEAQHLARAGDWLAVLATLDEVDYSPRNHHKYLAHVEALGYGSFIVEQRSQLDRALEQTDLRAAQASNLTSAAWVCRRLGRKTDARKWFQRAIHAAHVSANATVLYYALAECGYFLTDSSNAHRRAQRLLRMALAIAQAERSNYARAHCTLGIAFTHFQLQQNDECERETQRALALFRSVGDSLSFYRAVDCMVRLSMLYRKQSRSSEALAVTEEALTLAHNEHLFGWRGELESQLGFHKRALGAYEEAIGHHRQALRFFGEPLPLRRQQAVQHSYIGNLLIDIGEFHEAESAFENARWIATNIDITREQSWIAANRGILLCRLGNNDLARRQQQEALALTQRNQHDDSMAIRCTDLAETEIASGHGDEAARLLALAVGTPGAELLALAEIYASTPELEDALPHEMQAPGEQKRRGAALGRLLIEAGAADAALPVLDRALRLTAGSGRRDAGLHVLAGSAALRIKDLARAVHHFTAATDSADRALTRSGRFYPAAFARALACFGLAAAEKGGLDDARHAWARAVSLCSAPGVIEEAREMLHLIGI
jgi:tetratricopeptide (TPR) repeat protein